MHKAYNLTSFILQALGKHWGILEKREYRNRILQKSLWHNFI